MPRSRATLRVAGVASGFSLKYPWTAPPPELALAGGALGALIPGSVSRMSPTAVAAGPSWLGLLAPLPFACPFVAGADGAPAAGAAAPSSNTTSTPWTWTISPTLPRVSAIVPALGAVMVTVALSVITSTIG